MQSTIESNIKLFLENYSDNIKKPLNVKFNIDEFKFSEYKKTNIKKQNTVPTSKLSTNKRRNNETENGAFALETTGNALLDLFGDTLRDFNPERIFNLMDKCWELDPNKTLQMILYTRDVRNGKQEIKLGRFMMLWMRIYHPASYIKNFDNFIDVGYYKDVWILVDLVRENDVPMIGNNDDFEFEYYTEILKRDKKMFENGDKISLASKWTPKERSHHHNYFMKLSQMMFPNDKHKSNQKMRKWLSDMRKSLNTVETKMCCKDWDKIEYNTVPSYSMKQYKEAFKKHDEKRFDEYIDKLSKGQTKINTTGIQPHELVMQVMDKKNDYQVVEAQWNDLVKRIKSKSELNNSLAICDVSGSMHGIPLYVSIALGLLLSEIQDEQYMIEDKMVFNPYYKKVITFSNNPTFFKVDQDSLKNKIKAISNMEWKMNTDLMKVFKMILDMAVMYSVPKEQMPKTLFIFTDMQFDQANENKLPFDEINEMYKKNNYERPNIVFWNLRSSSGGFPISVDSNNTALVSGFSAELMRIFTNGSNFNPMELIDNILDKYSYASVHKNDLL